MRVKVDEIRERGTDRKESLTQEQVQAALEQTEYRALEGTDLSVHLERVGTGVLLKGQFTARVTTPCKRCVVDVPLTVPASFTLNLVPETLAKDLGAGDGGEDDERAERGGSFRLEDAEQDTFDGKVVDTSPIFREQLLLALPTYSVCEEACKGLCTVCGQNLNEKLCSCDTRQVDPRLAALKDIKLN